VLLRVGSGPLHVTVGDLNRDGNPDIIAANYGVGTISVLLGEGDGTFEPQVIYTTGSGPAWVATSDLNGDRRPDLLVVNQLSNNTTLLFNITR
jgi:hypothetical protein